jgi:hypothetical protein
VIALCTASLSASLGTWLYTDFCDDASDEVHALAEDSVNWKVYSQRLIGSDECNCELDNSVFQGLEGTICKYDDQSIMSVGVRELLEQAITNLPPTLHHALPHPQDLLQRTLQNWESGSTRLIVVDRKDLDAVGGSGYFSVSSHVDGHLDIFVGMPAMDAWNNVSEAVYEGLVTQIAAEALIHESCEAAFGLSHSAATIAELLISGDSQISTRMAIQLAWSNEAELLTIIGKTNSELMRHLSLGIDPNLHWDGTPEDVRKFVIARILGKAYNTTSSIEDWLSSHADVISLHDCHIKQCLTLMETAVWRIKVRGLSNDCAITSISPPIIWNRSNIRADHTFVTKAYNYIRGVYVSLYLFVQYIAIISGAGTDAGRELWYTLRNSVFQKPVVWVVMKVWKLCWWMKNLWVRIILLEQDPKYKIYSRLIHHGVSRSLEPHRVTVHDPQTPMTGFISSSEENGGIDMCIYPGIHTRIPSNPDEYSVASYNRMMQLEHIQRVRPTVDGREMPIEQHEYRYDMAKNQSKAMYPASRIIRLGTSELQTTYDKYGRIVSGEVMKSGGIFDFSYDYKAHPKNSRELVRASYTSQDEPRVVFTVYWCIAPFNKVDDIHLWVVSDRVQRFTVSTTEETKDYVWQYSHKRDPTISLNVYDNVGQYQKESKKMHTLEDTLKLFAKPTNISFDEENLIFYHSANAVLAAASAADSKESTTNSNNKKKLGRSKDIVRNPMSTIRLRTSLWKDWASRTDMDAVTVCYLDEKILRREPSLKKYWRLRDAAHFLKAKSYLNDHLDEIVSSIDISDEVAAKTPLMIRPADLFTMGLSKDSNHVVPKPEDAYIDTEDRVAVIFTDTGCWPDAPGGVSNCRRDLVDGHTTVRNYALTESASDFGIPRFQIERNIQATKNLPLWGLDGKSPTHGLLNNLLQSEVEHRIRRTRLREDIIETFIPLLRTFVRGARTIRFSRADIIEYTQVVLKINHYFEDNDYLTTWRSKAVRNAWRDAWLREYNSPNIRNPNDSFPIERPTAKDFDEAMELYISYMFIFSVRVPEKVPRVYQSTHHGISSLYGMILKIRRGTTWGIWDHAIMWRESCLNISPAQCILPVAVQSMLLGAMKMASHLAYTHADVILPCTAVYNP